MTVYAEKLLPHDLEAEEAVVGSIIIDGQCLTHVAPLLKAGDFYRDRNQILFDAGMALFQRDIAVDQTTLAGELQRTEKLDLVGGMAYLAHLVAISRTSAHAEDYAQAISRTSTMRRLIDAGSKIVDLGYSDTDDLEKTMRVAEKDPYVLGLFTVGLRQHPMPPFRSGPTASRRSPWPAVRLCDSTMRLSPSRPATARMLANSWARPS